MNFASESLLIKSPHRYNYEILATLHSSSQSTTYKARYLNSNTLLTIKVFPNYWGVIFYLIRAIVLGGTHPNITKVDDIFKHRDQLWIVMPFPSNVESLSSILNSSFSHGMSETYVAFVLKETLKAIQHVHEQGFLHNKVDLDHVFVDKGRGVKLDFGILSSENNEEQRRPVWMNAPDLEPSTKVDIWMFGLLAMELFYGKSIDCSDCEEFMKLVSRIRECCKSSRSKNQKSEKFIAKLIGRCFPSSSVCSSSSTSEKMPSRLLGEVIALCLDQNPLNRPTASELLKHKFFRRRPHDHKSMKREFFRNPHKYKSMVEINTLDQQQGYGSRGDWARGDSISSTW